MDENKNSKLAEIDELLERTSPENRMLFNKYNTAPAEPDKDFIHKDFEHNAEIFDETVNKACEDISSDFEKTGSSTKEKLAPGGETPVSENNFDEVSSEINTDSDTMQKFEKQKTDVLPEEYAEDNTDDASDDLTSPVAIDVKPLSDSEEESLDEAPESSEEDAPAEICIIDETSTDIIFEEGPELAIEEVTVEPTKKKGKKAKEKFKFNALQIVLIVIVSLVTLWTLVYTVDHTLASNGFSPLFYFSEKIYPDESVSYKCLGYKIQFMFDANGNVTQATLPAWKDGPNDIRFEDEFKNSANFN